MRSLSMLVLLACAGAWPALARAEPDISDQRVGEIFREIDGLDRPGCSVGVLREGRLVWASAYGAFDLTARTPLETRTVYNIGSVSKQFTAFAVLLLEQQRKLSLDDSVRKYVGELGEYANGVTLRHLLHHTGGLRDYIGLLRLSGHDYGQRTTREQALDAIVRQRSANFSPGTEHEYSNTGFFLLGIVVERVSGRSLAQFSHESIFAPLGMHDTRIVDRYPVGFSRLARGYSPDAEGYEIEQSRWEQTGDGQVHTTIEDLARWEENFITARLAGRDLIRRLHEPGRLVTGRTLRYAAGIALGEHRGLATARHGGDWAGYRAHYLRFPEQRFATVALCNRSDAPAARYTAALADLHLATLLKPAGPPHQVQDLRTIRGTTHPSAMPAGIYRNAQTGNYLRLITDDGTAAIEMSGERSSIESVERGVFHLPQFDETYVVFVRAASGGSASIVVQSSLQAHVFEPAPVWQPGRLDDFAGVYTSSEAAVRYELKISGGALLLDTGSRQLALTPMMPNDFAGSGLPGDEDAFSLRFSPSLDGFQLFIDGLRGLEFERRTMPTHDAADHR